MGLQVDRAEPCVRSTRGTSQWRAVARHRGVTRKPRERRDIKGKKNPSLFAHDSKAGVDARLPRKRRGVFHPVCLIPRTCSTEFPRGSIQRGQRNSAFDVRLDNEPGSRLSINLDENVRGFTRTSLCRKAFDRAFTRHSRVMLWWFLTIRTNSIKSPPDYVINIKFAGLISR